MNGSFRFAGDLFPELDRLQQHLDALFHGTDPTNIRALSRRGFPAINVGTSSDSVEIIAFVPGVDPKALQITVDRGLLIIAGERKADPSTGKDGESVHAQERYTGAFRRIVTLPEDADPAHVDATLRDGVLHVTVAKRESSKPRKIAIN